MISARTSYRLVRKELAAGNEGPKRFTKKPGASLVPSGHLSGERMGLLASISRECDAVHASLEISVRKVGRRHRHSGGQRQTWHRNQTVSHLSSRWFLRWR